MNTETLWFILFLFGMAVSTETVVRFLCRTLWGNAWQDLLRRLPYGFLMLFVVWQSWEFDRPVGSLRADLLWLVLLACLIHELVLTDQGFSRTGRVLKSLTHRAGRIHHLRKGDDS